MSNTDNEYVVSAADIDLNDYQISQFNNNCTNGLYAFQVHKAEESVGKNVLADIVLVIVGFQPAQANDPENEQVQIGDLVSRSIFRDKETKLPNRTSVGIFRDWIEQLGLKEKDQRMGLVQGLILLQNHFPEGGEKAMQCLLTRGNESDKGGFFYNMTDWQPIPWTPSLEDEGTPTTEADFDSTQAQ